MKRLFLASEGKHPESMKKLEEFVGGLKGKKIAYIPTAANGEIPYGTWEKGESWDLVNTSKAITEIVVLEDYKDSSVLAHLEDKDIIWMAGGMCGYLMYWLRRCEIDKHLANFLASGIVYVGSSAGSMVCAKTLDIAEVCIDDMECGASAIPGLGLIDFDIYPHYEDGLLPEIKKLWKDGDLYLLKNGEVVTVVGDKIEVLGDKRILRSGKLV